MKDLIGQRISPHQISEQQEMGKFNDFFKSLDRQKYPFIDGLYYLFMIVFLLVLFLFFA
ncbi:hypothetical protein DYBT9623_03791 [Dyadobacter sp. CECT 9623]|uniref:Uncharacterized protein n=1 Tax=Dyadobacter linearis TaxID=2823330 RepID=A0ABN7RAN6_9BACT|nr:hypothetical protein DYBT9623_03791 [Dyadobacter sp. CECT 9623]